METQLTTAQAQTEAAAISRARALATADYERMMNQCSARAARLQRVCPHWLGVHIKERPLMCPTCGKVL